MNFNEEMDRELRELGLGGQVVPIKEEDKGTEEDYVYLAKKGMQIDEKNMAMFRESAINAEYGMPCGNTIMQPKTIRRLSQEEQTELVERPTPTESGRNHMLRKIQQFNSRQ